MNITEINNKIAEIQERIADSHLCEGTASTI
jgi:hypothetical protein